MLEVWRPDYPVLVETELRLKLWLKWWPGLHQEFEQVIDRFKKSVQHEKCSFICLVWPCKISDNLNKWKDWKMLKEEGLAEIIKLQGFNERISCMISCMHGISFTWHIWLICMVLCITRTSGSWSGSEVINEWTKMTCE